MGTANIDKVFNRMVRSKQIHECVIYMENGSGDFTCRKEFGNKDIDAPLLMASVTKLWTTACVLILREQGKLSLEDNITAYLAHDALTGLHVFQGKDQASTLTISQLLFQTSGLPDAFMESKNNLRQRVLDEDMQLTFQEKMELTKQLKPRFAPDSKNRAHYADINFDLLGEIIERITGNPLEDVYQSFICQPLGLVKSYLPVNDTDFIPNLFYKDTAIARPRYIRDCRASGGAISTAREMMVFLKAFFGGKLFNAQVFQQLRTYRKLQLSMFPIQYGGGYMRIPLGGLSTMFMGKGELIGHTGTTGSFALYAPDKDLYMTGDTNQVANPALAIRLAMQLALSMK